VRLPEKGRRSGSELVVDVIGKGVFMGRGIV
jgi:hypothetical protein